MAKDRSPHSKYWKGKADTSWSKCVRLPARCAICGRADRRLEGHHLIPKQALAYRYDLRNGICLCSRCHIHDIKLSAHGAPWAFEDWMESHRPEQYAWWQEHRRKITYGLKLDYKAIRDDLETVYAEGKAYQWTCRQLGVTDDAL